MINRNLGIGERIVRGTLGVLLGGWILSQPTFGWLHGIGSIIALFLILNAFFARCYMWKWLGLNTCDENDPDCQKEPC